MPLVKGSDHGYSSWPVLNGGSIFLVDYTNLATRRVKAIWWGPDLGRRMYDRRALYLTAAYRWCNCHAGGVSAFTISGPELEYWLRGKTSYLEPSPIPEYDDHYAFDKTRHFILYVYHINRDLLFEDLFRTLSGGS